MKRKTLMNMYNLLVLASSSLTSDKAMCFLTHETIVLEAIDSHERQPKTLNFNKVLTQAFPCVGVSDGSS
ncbi:hypothetical protein V6N13_140950 [Hibiscus sabdariffa]